MRFYWPIAKLDYERHMVWGYASTEAEDDQGEIVRRDALEAALDDCMRFANIREMHLPSAVGVAEEAAIDERGLYLGARIVDGEAWEKVVAGVYKGFSIGGHVTARDPADRKIITGLALTEISVVDRPANPEAVFDCWKRAAPAAQNNDPPPQAREGGSPPGEPKPAGLIRGGDRVGAGAPAIRTAGVSPACRRVDQRLEAGAPGRLRALFAELCELLDSLSADDDEALAAVAIADSLRKSRRSDSVPLAAAVARLADDIVPRVDALQRRVDDIAKTPLPPATAARGVAIAKRDDGHHSVAAPDDIVAALARMTDEERTLTLIKAAHATPLRPRPR